MEKMSTDKLKTDIVNRKNAMMAPLTSAKSFIEQVSDLKKQLSGLQAQRDALMAQRDQLVSQACNDLDDDGNPNQGLLQRAQGLQAQAKSCEAAMQKVQSMLDQKASELNQLGNAIGTEVNKVEMTQSQATQLIVEKQKAKASFGKIGGSGFFIGLQGGGTSSAASKAAGQQDNDIKTLNSICDVCIMLKQLGYRTLQAIQQVLSGGDSDDESVYDPSHGRRMTRTRDEGRSR